MPQCFWSKFDTPLVLLWIQQSHAWDVKNPHLNLQFCQSLSWPRLLLPLDYLHLCPLTLLTGFFTSALHCQKTYLILQWVGELNWKAVLLFPSAHLRKLFSPFSPLAFTSIKVKIALIYQGCSGNLPNKFKLCSVSFLQSKNSLKYKILTRYKCCPICLFLFRLGLKTLLTTL